MLDIFDSIECCDMGDRNPDVRMIVNQKFLTNWKKMTKEWNRLLSVPTCCEAQDGMKDFNRLVSVRSYLQDRPFTPEFSDYLSKMYPNVSIALFVPQGWSIMRTFDTSIDQGLNVVNGTNVNFMSIKELDKDDNDCFNCERAIKITGSYLIANVGECT